MRGIALARPPLFCPVAHPLLTYQCGVRPPRTRPPSQWTALICHSPTTHLKSALSHILSLRSSLAITLSLMGQLSILIVIALIVMSPALILNMTPSLLHLSFVLRNQAMMSGSVTLTLLPATL